MSSLESEAIDALLKLSLPCDSNLALPAIRPQPRTNVSLPHLPSILLVNSDDINRKRNFLKSLSRAATKNKKKAVSVYSCSSSVSSDVLAKPRWQESERLELLEAIVKEKGLDDMKTIRWDRIAMVVGKAKKAYIVPLYK
ncbi:hypothetical protein K501DRAFT_329180 [Backusella circina FSU 941]|nr:hypothetical protein K501DRAFT_329180 [Backusella circina FSU 941]